MSLWFLSHSLNCSCWRGRGKKPPVRLRFYPGYTMALAEPEWEAQGAVWLVLVLVTVHGATAAGGGPGTQRTSLPELQRPGGGWGWQAPPLVPTRHNSPKVLSEACRPPLSSHKAGSMSARPSVLMETRRNVCLCRRGRRVGCQYPFPRNGWPVLSQEPRVTQISPLSLPIGVGMKLTDVGIATLAKG